MWQLWLQNARICLQYCSYDNVKWHDVWLKLLSYIQNTSLCSRNLLLPIVIKRGVFNLRINIAYVHGLIELLIFPARILLLLLSMDWWWMLQLLDRRRPSLSDHPYRLAFSVHIMVAHEWKVHLLFLPSICSSITTSSQMLNCGLSPQNMTHPWHHWPSSNPMRCLLCQLMLHTVMLNSMSHLQDSGEYIYKSFSSHSRLFNRLYTLHDHGVLICVVTCIRIEPEQQCKPVVNS